DIEQAGPSALTASEASPTPIREKPESNAPALLDEEKLNELEAALPFATLKNLISLYLTDVDLHLAEIAQCRATDDFDGVSRQAHTIVSISGNLGAMRTSEAARRLETACRDGDHERSDQLIGELDEASTAASAALRVWSKDRSPAATLAIAS
ncbi:MAG TPA: Hpt domain-containing protein, partial [Rhizomicrobium sp.]|nr:Hpt domain-containing protein [Rhizomicrobium sp.]